MAWNYGLLFTIVFFVFNILSFCLLMWCLLVITPWLSSSLMSRILWFYSPFSVGCLSSPFGSLKEVTSRGCNFVIFFKIMLHFAVSLSFFYHSQWSSESWSLSFWYYNCFFLCSSSCTSITNMHDLWTATHSFKLVSLAFFIAFWDNFILFI